VLRCASSPLGTLNVLSQELCSEAKPQAIVHIAALGKESIILAQTHLLCGHWFHMRRARPYAIAVCSLASRVRFLHSWQLPSQVERQCWRH